jgi:cleavage and polyadenylation specificity factor subunit 3
MGRLRSSLQARYKDRDEDVKIHTPRNLETLRLSFRGERVAKVLHIYSPLIAETL